MAGLRFPSHGRSRQTGYPIRPSAEGRSNWLNFPRKTLSFSIPNRFYPGTLRPLLILLWKLCEAQLQVRLGWSSNMFKGTFQGLQPEDVSMEVWQQFE